MKKLTPFLSSLPPHFSHGCTQTYPWGLSSWVTPLHCAMLAQWVPVLAMHCAMPSSWACRLERLVFMHDSGRHQRPLVNPMDLSRSAFHACLPGELTESPLCWRRRYETQRRALKSQGFVSCEGEDKHKRRETKSKVGETVCSWILTTSHFSAKGSLASGNMEIASSHSHSPERRK